MNMEKEVFEVYLDDIIPNRFQPRENFDEKNLNQLSQSIREHGIIQPLVLRKIGDKYEIVAGERRYKAAVMAGLNKVPAVVANLNDAESAEIALIENIQRQDLSPIEVARTYQKILDMGHLTQAELANKLGVTQPTIANKLRLLNLDEEVQDALLKGKISERHARSLLNLNTKEEQRKLLHEIIEKRLNVRETDRRTRPKQEILTPTTPKIPAVEIIGDDDDSSEGEQISPIVGIDRNGLAKETTIPNVADNLGVDISKVKEDAVDINPIKESAPINDLLESGEKKSTVGEEPKSKFFVPFDDDNEAEETKEPPIIDRPSSEGSALNRNINTQPSNNNNPVNTHAEHLNPQIERENNMDSSGMSSTVQGIRGAVDTVRQCVKTIEMSGFDVDSEEFDFEGMYQVIIKIHKK